MFRCPQLVKEDKEKKMMVGFVQMARGKLMEKHTEIRVDWRNVANDLGDL